MCDNYDNSKMRDNTDSITLDLRRFFPEVNYRLIIITTRSSQVKLSYRIKVGKLENIRDNLKILSHTSGRGNAGDSKIFSR